MSEEKALTLKQEKFCHYYVDTDGNASEAYRMAYDAAKMKAESIWVTACRLLKEPKVALRIKEIKEKRAKESEVKREAVEKVLIPKRLRNALKKIQNSKGKVSYEFNGKTEAARLLGAWNGWDAPTKIDLTSSGGKTGELRIGFDDDSVSEV